MILKTLAYALSTKVKQKHPDIPKYIDRLVPSIFNLFVTCALLASERPMVATDPRLIQVAAEIITMVVQSLPVQRQQSYSVGVSKAITTGNVMDIAQGFQKVVSNKKLSLFNVCQIPFYWYDV